MKNALTPEIAEKELQSWLDFKKISKSRVDTRRGAINALKEGLIDGTLTILEDKTIVHELKFEVGLEHKIKEIKYKPRITAKELNERLKVLSAEESVNTESRLLAAASAVTGVDRNVLALLDTEDATIAQGIGLFFL